MGVHLLIGGEERVETVARSLAEAAGADPDQAVDDADMLGNPATVSMWMLWMPDARKLLAALLKAPSHG